MRPRAAVSPFGKEDEGAVRQHRALRPEAYNVTRPARQLGAALDAADRDHDVRVVLLSAEGRRSAPASARLVDGPAGTRSEAGERVWDTVADVQMIGTFGKTFAKLHEISKPTVAAVRGWCMAGGTDMVLNADLIVAGEGARFGYPPAARCGGARGAVALGRAARARACQALPVHRRRVDRQGGGGGGHGPRVRADDQLHERSTDLAQRIALLPLNQLQMIKWMLNDVARHQYQPDTSRLFGFIFDGVARRTQEGSTSWLGHRRWAGGRRCVTATGRSATTASAARRTVGAAGPSGARPHGVAEWTSATSPGRLTSTATRR